jgi:hypothetical protein
MESFGKFTKRIRNNKKQMIDKIEDIYWNIREKIERLIYPIKYAYQRAVRGYDDTAEWSLGCYLAPIIRDVTLNMAKNGCGYPINLTDKKWKKILKDISDGFDSKIKMNDVYFLSKEYKAHQKRFYKALQLFVKYYEGIWN